MPARNALAQELASRGQAKHARETRTLKRPTLSAWVVNQLAHQHPEKLQALLASARTLERAHRRALSGVAPEALKEANRAFQKALDTLVAAAGATLAASGRPASGEPLRQAEETLRAASLGSEEERTALSQGMLTRPLRLSGFGALSPLLLVGPSPKARARLRSTAPPAKQRPARAPEEEPQAPPPRRGVVLRGPWAPRDVQPGAEARRPRAAELEQRKRAAELERLRREARQHVERAERAEQRARRELKRTEAALETAEAKTRRAREALERAVEAERRRAEAASRARAQVRSAELALAQERRHLRETESRQPP